MSAMRGDSALVAAANGVLRAMALERVARRVRRSSRNRAIVGSFFDGRAEFDRYRAELDASELPAKLERLMQRFDAAVVGETPRGNAYSFGEVGPEAGARLYALVRKARPRVCVETGVCNGVSSAFILQALHDNDLGRLYSIDFPEYAGATDGDRFWSGKGGAVIPAGESPGWVIPRELLNCWELRLGRSQDELPPLLERTGPSRPGRTALRFRSARSASSAGWPTGPSATSTPSASPAWPASTAVGPILCTCAATAFTLTTRRST